ncbi:hypothetical protein [Paraburkholderia fungorum]
MPFECRSNSGAPSLSHAAYTVSQGGGGTTPAPGIGQLGVMAGIRHSF